ncbi:siderophore-interacting protein [Microbacterium invictum]|uniref:NADPH-dependent ferric siderophore reductase n=1 Tax=Microbacterium invictum TaxID=515415 RepID=A0AA40SNM6_9MICO|nr:MULTISPECIES: siderophore-interacting protein [Microbacterium]MBB4139437.1 NADPH-dependent ferric siderophore reductase [Microbacterium invictum]
MAQRSFVPHPIVVRELTVARVADVTPRMRRVTLTGAQLASFHRDGLDLPAFVSTGFDDHVKLVFATEGDVRDMLPIQRAHSIDWTDAEHRALRDYTPRRVTADELDLDFVRHGHGPAASWAESTAIGDSLFILGPKSSILFPDDVDWVVLAGDETALPAIGRYLDERPLDVPVQIVVEVHDTSAVQELALRTGDTLTWVKPGELVDTVTGLEWWHGSAYVWAGAESSALLPLRRWLSREKQVPKTHVNITGYWHVTADDAEAGEVPGEASAAGDIERLLSPIPWFAVRTALSLGILDRVAAGRHRAADLAAASRVPVAGLQTLLDVLLAHEILRSDAGVLTLGPVGEHVLADDHLRESLDDTAEARTILALAQLEGALRGDVAFAEVSGASLATAVDADADGYAERYDETMGFDFVAAGVVDHLGDARRVAVTGPGSAAFSKAVADRAHVRVVESAAGVEVLRAQISEPHRSFTSGFDAAAAGFDADLAVAALALAYRTDDEATEVLTRLRTASPRGWIIEQVAAPHDDATTPHAHEAEHGLLTFMGTGSAPRTVADLARLAATSGWDVVSHEPIGWNHEVIELRRA